MSITAAESSNFFPITEKLVPDSNRLGVKGIIGPHYFVCAVHDLDGELRAQGPESFNSFVRVPSTWIPAGRMGNPDKGCYLLCSLEIGGDTITPGSKEMFVAEQTDVMCPCTGFLAPGGICPPAHHSLLAEAAMVGGEEEVQSRMLQALVVLLDSAQTITVSGVSMDINCVDLLSEEFAGLGQTLGQILLVVPDHVIEPCVPHLFQFFLFCCLHNFFLLLAISSLGMPNISR